MDRNGWPLRAQGPVQTGKGDSYGRLLEMLSLLEEGSDPKLTEEQVEFFKSLIAGLIDTMRSFKHEKRS